MRRHSLPALLLASVLALPVHAQEKEPEKPAKGDEKKGDEKPKTPDKPDARPDKKDEVFLDGVEKVDLKEPLLRVTRPSKSWVFLNLDLLKKQELDKATRRREAILEEQSRLHARLYYGSASATFFVMSWVDDRKDLTAETLGGEVLAQTKAALKDGGKVTANGRAKHGKLEAWGIELEGAPAAGGEELCVSKLVFVRPEDRRVFLLILEHPKKHAELVKKEKGKLFSGVKVAP